MKASQWWFYLYGLCSEGVAEGGVSVLIEALQQLMETSTVGEYPVRLSLLKAFSFHYNSEGMSEPYILLRLFTS